ncbi:uncharacterized protein Ypel isoform X3 [Maniola hyperantus]|uniref:uncharacterized protein Ypel isoform X3 n=1 Tax=Aphantopus hyperantus TaxID=2795564 RepID=UPI0037498A7D
MSLVDAALFLWPVHCAGCIEHSAQTSGPQFTSTVEQTRRRAAVARAERSFDNPAKVRSLFVFLFYVVGLRGASPLYKEEGGGRQERARGATRGRARQVTVGPRGSCGRRARAARARQSFQGSQGRAYLFNSVVNVGCGPAEERVLLTGLHAVADIYCECCKTMLGWKYEYAFESSQKYKEGKFIIELAHMVKENGWD